MKFWKIGVALLALATMAGCQRIETGEIGLRVGFDKQVQKTELQPGSFNQVFVGDVLVFPVREIAMQLDKMQPQTADNSTLADMDITVIYSITPAAVADLYSTKAHSLHAIDGRGETLLMYNYIQTIAHNSAYKAVAKYDALKTISKRQDIETDIKNFMVAELADKKLLDSININQVQVRNIQPAQNIIDSANAVITAENAQRQKQVEVQTAHLEADRLKALAGSGQSIEYMKAKALQDVAEGIKEGKVNTVVIPYDFKGFVSVGK